MKQKKVKLNSLRKKEGKKGIQMEITKKKKEIKNEAY